MDFLNSIHIDYAYFNFGLICLGFEFLGKCLSEDFSSKKGDGGDFFKKAINILPNHKYKPVIDKYKIYKSMRNGLLHSLKPTGTVWLRTNSTLESGNFHLSVRKIKNEFRVVLVFEDFLKDFNTACSLVIKMIDNDTIKNKSIHKEFILTSYVIP